jgi:alpha-N-arabinofuranosidase
MGRCIYGGVYDPASPHADERGLRTDVLAALRELNFRSIRYPGGNFLSGYRWEDGVGPREQRPRRRELAWHSIETNQFGTNEFIDFCKAVKAAPMLGVNMGTGTIQDAAALVEYCNAPTGSHYSDLRAAHGYPAPHGVAYWCLGNEMDGPWQIGHLDAVAYSLKAREAAKLMRWQDPAIKLIACGSSSSSMPTYPEWDRVVLEACWDQVDYHSLHYYANNDANDTGSFLALSAQFEAHLDTLSAVLRYVKAKTRSKHDVYLSWDEWNVWYKDRTMDGQWTEAPHLIEEVYNLEDALVVAQWLNVFLRKSDVLKIACIAQIVNIIAPILTTREALLKQSSYYPLMLFSKLAKGVALDVSVRAPLYHTAQFGDMPLLDVSAAHDAADGSAVVFIVNRNQIAPQVVELHWQDRTPTRFTALHQVAGTDPKAANSFEDPTHIIAVQRPVPPANGNLTSLTLPPLSFTALEVRF